MSLIFLTSNNMSAILKILRAQMAIHALVVKALSSTDFQNGGHFFTGKEKNSFNSINHASGFAGYIMKLLLDTALTNCKTLTLFYHRFIELN